MHHLQNKYSDGSPSITSQLSRMSMYDKNTSIPSIDNVTDESASKSPLSPPLHGKLIPIHTLDFPVKALQQSYENNPERIIFILDSPSQTSLRNRQTKHPLHAEIKAAVKMFINVKLHINPKTEFAIWFMNRNKTCMKIQCFTNSRKMLFSSINKISFPLYKDEPCSLDNVFQEIALLMQNSYPKIYTRALFLYSRYLSDLCIKDSSYFQILANDKYIIVDAIHIFVKPDDEEQLLQFKYITKSLEKMAFRGQLVQCLYNPNGYFLRHSLAKLLAHPMQRSRNTDYSKIERLLTAVSGQVSDCSSTKTKDKMNILID